MVRLAYLIPRVIIFALVGLACWVGSDPLIRRAVIYSAQNSTGGIVEIGHLRYSMGNHKVFLKDVMAADARAPMQNLLQAEMIYAELNPQGLLRRQFVIEHGQTSDIVFGAPRTKPGGLVQFAVEPRIEFQWKPKQFEPLEEIGLAWLDGFQLVNAAETKLEDLAVLKAANGLPEFWQQNLNMQSTAIAELAQSKAKLFEIQNSYRTNNPLRKHLVNVHAEFEELKSRSQTIEQRLEELQQLATKQRAAIVSAHKLDSRQLRQSMRTTRFDSDSVSKLLLTKLQEEQVAEVIGWFQWFRQTMPDPKTDFRTKNKRGVDILFTGVTPKPSFLIKKIDLEGEGRFANQHVNFAGSAFDLTSEPEYHDKPATFEIRAQGDQHLIVNCSLDRRGEEPIDTLNVVCPDLILPARLLGEEKSMLVTMAPASHIQADIQVHAVGEQISGELVFRHSNVSLYVDKLHEMVGGEKTALQLNQGLATVDRFESRVTLSGTFDDYQYQFQSDLGSRFAKAANSLLLEKSENNIAAQMHELDSFLNTQLAVFDQQIIPQIRRMTQLLKTESVEIASLQDVTPVETDRLRKIR